MAFTDEQRRNAAVIIRVGREVGASARDILIALMTALQESGLRNLDYGDSDSVGLFQQRPSMSWGTVEQIRNPEYAARSFFLGAGTNGGLLDLTERNSMSLTQAAQAVQRSAYPNAYAKHEDPALRLLESLGDGKGLDGTLGATPGYIPEPPTINQPTIGEALEGTLGDFPGAEPAPENSALGTTSNPALGGAYSAALEGAGNAALATPMPFGSIGADSVPGQLPSVDELLGQAPGTTSLGYEAVGGWRSKVVKTARNLLGVAYQWGGSTPAGVDCSGLLYYAFKQAGIDIPRVSYEQANAGQRVGLDALKPGDLVAWDNSSRNPGADHIALYIGNGLVIEAARPGTSVQVSSIYDRDNAWGVRLNF